MLDRSSLEARCNAMLRDGVHAWWEQSGRDFGRAEPPPPTLRVDAVNDGELRVSVDEFGVVRWEFPWDGSEAQLREWIETVAEDYWSKYVATP
jgi:hypothetical protein